MSGPWKFLLSCSCDVSSSDIPNWFRVLVDQEYAVKVLRMMRLASEIFKVNETFQELVFWESGPDSSRGQFYDTLNEVGNDVRNINEWSEVAEIRIHVDVNSQLYWSGYHENTGLTLTSDSISIGQFRLMAEGRPPDYVEPEEEEEGGS